MTLRPKHELLAQTGLAIRLLAHCTAPGTTMYHQNLNVVAAAVCRQIAVEIYCTRYPDTYLLIGEGDRVADAIFEIIKDELDKYNYWYSLFSEMKGTAAFRAKVERRLCISITNATNQIFAIFQEELQVAKCN